eukprot:jgi/Tetstr1/443227/TSEL_031265.t1
MPDIRRFMAHLAAALLGVTVYPLAVVRGHTWGAVVAGAVLAVGFLCAFAEVARDWLPCQELLLRLGVEPSIRQPGSAGAKPLRPCCGKTPIQWLGVYNGSCAALLLLVAAVACATPDPTFPAFPTRCPPSLPAGCSRIAAENPQRDGGWAPLRAAGASAAAAEGAVAAWAEGEGGYLLREDDLLDAGGSQGRFLHYRFLSQWFGFPDDMLIRISIQEGEGVMVEVQGQLRIGYSDMDVNYRRNVRCLRAVSKTLGTPAT